MAAKDPTHKAVAAILGPDMMHYRTIVLCDTKNAKAKSTNWPPSVTCLRCRFLMTRVSDDDLRRVAGAVEIRLPEWDQLLADGAINRDTSAGMAAVCEDGA